MREWGGGGDHPGPDIEGGGASFWSKNKEVPGHANFSEVTLLSDNVLRDILMGTPKCVCLFVETQIAAKWSHVRYVKLAGCKRDFPFFLE